jgi:hypothetical protein
MRTHRRSELRPWSPEAGPLWLYGNLLPAPSFTAFPSLHAALANAHGPRTPAAFSATAHPRGPLRAFSMHAQQPLLP